MQVGSITKDMWPKGNADCLRPVLACVKELLPGALGQVSDGSLCYSILEVGIDSAEGESLIHAILKLLSANRPLSQW